MFVEAGEESDSIVLLLIVCGDVDFDDEANYYFLCKTVYACDRAGFCTENWEFKQIKKV